MTNENVLYGVLVDESRLTIHEIARACAVEPTWIVRHVEEGLIECEMSQLVSDINDWRFASRELQRARKLLSFERDFDANPEVAALIVDLLEEIAELKRTRWAEQ
jgi:chaperone modulatory protein CbpM